MVARTPSPSIFCACSGFVRFRKIRDPEFCIHPEAFFGIKGVCSEVPTENCVEMSGCIYKAGVRAVHRMNKHGGFGGLFCAEPCGDDVA